MGILLGRRKSAVSNIVAYVLLIVVTLMLSVGVFSWLRFYVGTEENVATCPSGVDIIVKSYNCFESEGENTGRLIITLKNKGRFSIDGYFLKVHDRKDAGFGIYSFDDVGVPLAPGDEYEATYYFENYSFDDDKVLETLTLVEIQPFITEEVNISCKSYFSQKLVCSDKEKLLSDDDDSAPGDSSGNDDGGTNSGGGGGNNDGGSDDDSGSGGVPYSIGSCADLDEMRNDLDGNYILQNDIGCYADTHVGGSLWNGGNGFNPVGNDSTPFSGSFNGGGFKIIGLYINKSSIDDNYVGLFGYIDSNVEIRDVGLEDVDVHGYWYIGGLVGYSEGFVNNSYVTGLVSANRSVGGIIGYNDAGALINNSYSLVNVTYRGGVFNGRNERMGGLVGDNYGMISSSYATGDVLGNDVYVWPIGSVAGGLSGTNYGTIIDSYATGHVESGSRGGGLVGYNNGLVVDSYATGSIQGRGNMSALIGYMDSNGQIINSYSTGMVLGNGNNNGGLVGYSDGKINDSYSSSYVQTYLVNHGGLVGYLDSNGVISDSYATGTTNGQGNVGGLVGYSKDALIIRSYATGNMRYANNVGGLIGYSDGATVTDCYASNFYLEGDLNVGGLIGNAVNTVVTNCYSTGDEVNGDDVTGGLIGRMQGGQIVNSYSTNDVVGAGISGLVGGTVGTITNSYWSGNQSLCCSGACGDCSFESTTSDFYLSSHAVYSGWDFVGVWQEVGGDYPTLI